MQSTIAVLCDLYKAFDTIDHNKLLHTLYSMEFVDLDWIDLGVTFKIVLNMHIIMEYISKHKMLSMEFPKSLY